MSFIYNQKIIFHLEKEKNENPSELIFITPSNSNKDPLSHKPCLVFRGPFCKPLFSEKVSSLKIVIIYYYY